MPCAARSLGSQEMRSSFSRKQTSAVQSLSELKDASGWIYGDGSEGVKQAPW